MGDFTNFVPSGVPTGGVLADAPATITRDDVIRIAKEEGADPQRALAHWKQESSSGTNAVTSTNGARGGFQLMPGTFRSVMGEGYDIDNPEHNARAGARLIKQNQDRYPNNPDAQVAAYFTNPKLIDQHGGDVSKMGHIKDANGVSVPDYVRGVLGKQPQSGFTDFVPSQEQGSAAPVEQASNGFTGFMPDEKLAAPSVPGADHEEPGLVSDTGNLLGQGAAQAVQGVVYAANKASGGWIDKFSEEHLGAGLNQIVADVNQHYADKLSPAMQRAAQEEWISSQPDETFGDAWKDPRAYYNIIVSSLPATIATLGPAGLAAKFAAATAFTASITKSVALKLAPQVAQAAAERAAIKAATYAAVATGGAGEGIIAGGQQGQQVEDYIAKLPDSVLEQAPAYQKALAENKGDRAKARAAVSNDAGTQALWQVGVSTALLGAGFDGYVGAQIAKRMTRGGSEMTRMMEALHGAAVEVPTEFSQGFAEQYLSNLAQKEHANPQQNMMEGVMNNAVGSAVAAGPTGLGFGAMTGGGHKPTAVPPAAPPAAQPAESEPAGPGGAPPGAPAPVETAAPSKEDVEKAAELTDTNPTEAEKKNGKYAKGIVDFHGLQISIENPKGSERSGTSSAGKAWSITMPHHYGEIEGTVGTDGDKVDVFIGPHPDSPAVFVVDQHKPNSEDHDEYKVMVGFQSARAAKKGYMDAHEKGWTGLGSMRQMSIPELKAAIASGKLNKNAQAAPSNAVPASPASTAPAAETAAPVQPVESQEGGTPQPEGEPNAVTEGQQQQSGEPEHLGTPSGENIPGDSGEIRGGPSPEAVNRNSDERGGTEQPSPEGRAAPAAEAPVQIPAGQIAAGYWEGPNGEFEETTEKPSLAERARELALHDRRWYAAKPQTRDQRLEAVAKVYDSIGDATRAANVRRKIGEASATGEDLDTLERVAETAQRVHENQGGTTVTGGEATPAGPKAPPEVSSEPRSPPVAPPEQPKPPKEPPKEPKAPREPKAPKPPKETPKPEEPKAPPAPPKEKAPEDTVAKMIAEKNGDALTKHIYEAAQLKPTFDDGVTVLDEGIVQMSVSSDNQKAVESVMKKMGFRITDRAKEGTESKRIELYAMYKPEKGDIQDTGVIGGKPANQGGEKPLPEPKGDVEQDIDALNESAKISDHFTIERPEATFGTMLYLEALREQLKTFLQFAGPAFGGSEGNARYGKSLKQALMDAAKTPEGMQQVRDQATRYIGLLAKLEETTKGAKSVSQALLEIIKAGWDTKDIYGDLKANKQGSEWQRIGLYLQQVNGYFTTFQPNENTIDQTNRVVKKDPKVPPRLESVIRIGMKDYRKGQNVNEDSFKVKFDFRDVEFGEWVNQVERQENLNLAYDSLMDMATNLGIDPKFVGLNGTLALSFGSRGAKISKASAHFEKSGVGGTVINLTKTRGNGTVSHEWMHALEDHLLGVNGPYVMGLRNILQRYWETDQMEGRVRSILTGERTTYGADRNKPPKDRALEWLKSTKEGTGWHGDLLKYRSTYFENAIAMDGDGDAYYKTPAEMVARAEEAYLFDIVKGGSPYLVGPMVRDGAMTKATGYKGTAYPTGKERERFAQDYKNFFSGLEFSEGGIRPKKDAKNPQEIRREEAQAKASEIAGRIDKIMEEMGLKQFPEIKNGSMVESMFYHLKNGWFPENARDLIEWVAQAHRVTNDDVKSNLLLQKAGQEDFEAALGQYAAQRITDWRIEGRDQKGIFDGLIDLYRKQPKLNIRTSTSSSLQQFSTPLPVAYIAGLLARVQEKSVVYEPTAGNGLLAITATAKNVIANELEAHRAQNLKLLGFPRVTTEDAVKAQDAKVFKPGEADVVLANPPFGKLENPALVDGYQVTRIDQLIVGRSLPAMFDKGRAVLLIGANKVPGEINSREHFFFNWLYSHYNVASHFEFDGDFYERQGAAWPIRVITIAGRARSNNAAPKSGTIPRVSYNSAKAQESYDELWKQYESSKRASDAIISGDVGAKPAGEPGNRPGSAEGPTVPGSDQGEADQVTGGSGRGLGEGRGTGVPGGRRTGNPVGGLPGRVGGTDAGNGAGVDVGVIGGPGQRGAGEPGTGPGSDGGTEGAGPGNVPLGGTGLEGLTPEDIDRIFNGDPVLVADPKTGAPEESDTGPKKPPTGPRGGGGKPSNKSKSGVTAVERALGIDLSNEFAEIGKIIGDPENGGSMFSRKLYEDALGTVDSTIYQQLKGVFDRIWATIRSKISDATRALIEFKNIVASRFGQSVERINNYAKVYMLDKMYPADRALPKSDEGKENLNQVPYKGKSQGENMGILVPRWLAASLERALDKLEDKIQDEHHDIDAFVQHELGYGSTADMYKAMSGYQIDNVALAIDQIRQGRGMIIGDATGVGKGRQAAAMIYWSIKNGKIPVFMSFKDDLYSQMYEDLINIGHPEVTPFLTNTDGVILDPRDKTGKKKLFATDKTKIKEQISKIAETGKLPEGRHALFTSYAQINTENDRRKALAALLKSGNAVMIMDEAHNASGEQKGKTSGADTTGGWLMNVFNNYSPPVVYLSATYAKRTDNMPIYMRTNLGMLSQDPQELIAMLSAGGPQMQTVLAQMLVEDGQMSRREKDMSMLRVKYKIDDENLVRDTRLADEATEGLRAIVRADRTFYEWFKQNQESLVSLLPPGSEITWGKGDKSHTTQQLKHGQFTSVVHNFIKQLLLSIKADNAVSEVVASLNRNEKPVIPLENTMEAALNYYIESKHVKQGDTMEGYGWKTVLAKALDRRRTFTYKDPQGKKAERYEVPFSMLPPNVLRTFTEAQEIIDKFETPLSASPIDYMRQKLAEYGWKYTGKKDANGAAERIYKKLSEAKGERLTPLRVAEITGRKNIIDYSGPVPVLGNRNKEQDRSIHVVREFNDGQIDALFLNASGSTGINLHASHEFRDQRKRHMFVLQAAGDISVFQQTMGRVHRTGQMVAPDYAVIATALPSEKRPMAWLKKKTTSLLSNTTGGQQSATDVEAVDFINMYGDEAVTEYLREHSDVADFIDAEIPDQGSPEGIALTASGRIALLPVAEQKSFYEQVEHAYNAIITMKNEAGTNKLIVRTLDTKAIEQQEQELTGGSGESIFNSPSYLAKYSILVQGERPKPEEVKAALKEALTNKDGTPRTYIDILREIEEARQAPFEQAKSAELNRIEGAGGLAEKLNEKDISPAKHRDITAQIASIKKKMALFDQVKISTKSQLQVLKVGYGARLALENGELPFGTIIGIKSNLPATGNPWSPSNFVVNFMINNENRRASIPLSKITRDNVIDQDLRPVDDNAIDFHYKLRTGEISGERPREDRFFVVGNIPAGFQAANLIGDVVTFTMADGSVRTGLFMPRNFKPESVADQNLFLSNRARYGEQYADGIYDYLTAAYREGSSMSYRDRDDITSVGTFSKDNVVRLVGDKSSGDVELIIQRSGGGKKIAENKDLVAITGELTTQPKRPWSVTVSGADKIKEMIKFIALRKGLIVSSQQVPTSQKYMAKYEKRSDTAAFSRGQPVAEPAAVWEVQQAVNSLLSKWADAPPVEVVKSIADLPSEIRAQIEREGANDVGGVFHDGKVYLVAANLSAQDAQTTLVHEVKGHYGLRKTFGKGLASILDQVATARAAQVNALLKAQGMPNTPEARARAAEEVLAIMAQGQPTLGFVRRAVAAIVAWLRQHGILAADKLTDAEIIKQFILPAARTVERGGAGEPDPGAFSRSAVYSRTSELFDALTKSDSKVGLWSRTVGTQFNLAKNNPTFRKVFERGQDFLSDIWRHATAAEKMAPNWFKRGWLQGISRKDADAASQFLLHGTLLDKVWSDDQLARGVNVKTPEGEQQLPGLTPQQIKMYHEAHAAIRVSLETQAKAFMAKASKSIGVRIDKEMSMDDMAADIQLQLGQRIAEAKGSIETLEGAKPEGYSEKVDQLKAAIRGDQKSVAYIEELVGHVNKLSDEGYFPLSRFGTHYVAVYRTKEDYDEKNAAHFSLHEGLTKGLANTKSNLEAQRLRKVYPNAFKIDTGTISKDSFRLYDGLNLDALELFAKHLGMDKDELFQEAYRELFASRSLMKRMIHRKGVPGYSKDAYRGLADFIMTTARATSATENFPEMAEAVANIPDGDLKDHAVSLYEYLKDPVEEAHKLRGYLFFHFIGGSLASALTNLTQTPLVTAPFLSKYVNPAAVTARMAAAAKDAVKDPFAKNLRGEFVHTGQLWDDLRKAEEDGTTAAQEIFQMMGVASGSKLAGNKYAESFLKAWGAMFGYAETFNRRVAYIAAHNIAESDSALGDPHKFAENAVFETQFLYNKGNRPVWGRGPIGSTMFTFKQFNINVLELLHRMPLQQKIYMMFLLMLAAGVEGLPFAEDLEDLIDTIGQRFPELGVTTNSKKWLDKTARKVFGQFLGNAFVQGLPSAASPFDVSQRLSMGNLIPGTAFGKMSETDKFRDVRDLVGPAAGLVYGAFGGLEDLLKGNYLSAAKKAAPTAVQNLIRGTEMAATGEAKDTRGQFVTKVGVGEALGKAAGLNPNKVADIQRVQRNIKTDENLIQVMKSDLLDQYVNAIINHRQDDINAISKKIMAWNKSHPDMPIVMSPSAIRNRIALARMSGENRLIKQAPKPLRGNVAEQLRDIK